MTNKYFFAIKVPIIIATTNFFLGLWLYGLLPNPIATGMYNLIRITNVIYPGWLVIQPNSGGLWLAALTGPILSLIDQVLLEGGYFILSQGLTAYSGDNEGLLAFIGALVSYIAFIPLLLVGGLLGGWLARRNARGRRHY
ncbi:MAG: hypothetical protein HZB33_15365 [Nitrospirae bacterium]|nr:hypothetical protein [Nitrospirota bacterium]